MQARLVDLYVDEACSRQSWRGQNFADARARVGLVPAVAKNVSLSAPALERGNRAVEGERDLGTAVGGNDVLKASAGNDLPLVQDCDVRAELLELREVVRGVDDGCAICSELTDRAQDLAARFNIRPNRGLVHENQSRPVHDRHARVESALLATREMRGVLASFFTQAKQLHDLAGAHDGFAAAKPV